MGRPKLHDAHTAEALVDTAERIVEADGLEALTVRRVAEELGTTTRAVYSAFGSKDALVGALGRRAFELLRDQVQGLPATPDPASDLVEAGVQVFRCFATGHPSLFRIGVQRMLPDPVVTAEYRDTAADALAALTARVERVQAAGGLGDRTTREAVLAFHALCEGLAAVELRGLLPPGGEERVWRDALSALVHGFALPATARR